MTLATTRDRSASIANEGDDRERGEGPSLDGAPTAVGWTRTDANATRRRERHRDDTGTIKDGERGKRKERTNETWGMVDVMNVWVYIEQIVRRRREGARGGARREREAARALRDPRARILESIERIFLTTPWCGIVVVLPFAVTREGH